jgi:hypothetical protein
MIGNSMLGDTTNVLVPAASFNDFALMDQFGLRQEPMKPVQMLGNNTNAYVTYAIAEVARATMNWRTYSCTIPFRPEMHVGFPIYLPHLDIYGYPTNISWSYTRGGEATMTLNCGAVRPRSMFEQQKSTSKGVDGKYTTTMEMTFIPNMVYKWSSYAQPVSADEPPPVRLTDPSGDGNKVYRTENPPLEPLTDMVFQTGKGNLNSFVQNLKSSTVGQNMAWRLMPGAGGFFSTAKPVDEKYYDEIRLRSIPYTDDKGFLLITPFPLGRFQIALDPLPSEDLVNSFIQRP